MSDLTPKLIFWVPPNGTVQIADRDGRFLVVRHTGDQAEPVGAFTDGRYQFSPGGGRWEIKVVNGRQPMMEEVQGV